MAAVATKTSKVSTGVRKILISKQGPVVRKVNKVIHRIATFSSPKIVDLLECSNLVFSILKLKEEV